MISEILNDLGDEWEYVGKHQWSKTFKSAAKSMTEIGESLSSIRDEYETGLSQSKKAESIIDDYRNAIRSNKTK